MTDKPDIQAAQGPYRVDGNGWISDAKGNDIAGVIMTGHTPANPATARLLAASWDLLEALKELLPEGWGDEDGHMDHMPGVKKARLAIAKAETP